MFPFHQLHDIRLRTRKHFSLEGQSILVEEIANGPQYVFSYSLNSNTSQIFIWAHGYIIDQRTHGEKTKTDESQADKVQERNGRKNK